MHKPLSAEEIARINAAEPVKTEMTIAQRRARWAQVLRNAGRNIVMSSGRLECLGSDALRATRWDNSPMALAAADPELKAAGLEGDTIGHLMNFMSMSDQQAHLLSCYCHGQLSGEQMAQRIESMTGPF